MRGAIESLSLRQTGNLPKLEQALSGEYPRAFRMLDMAIQESSFPVSPTQEPVPAYMLLLRRYVCDKLSKADPSDHPYLKPSLALIYSGYAVQDAFVHIFEAYDRPRLEPVFDLSARPADLKNCLYYRTARTIAKTPYLFFFSEMKRQFEQNPLHDRATFVVRVASVWLWDKRAGIAEMGLDFLESLGNTHRAIAPELRSFSQERRGDMPDLALRAQAIVNAWKAVANPSASE